MDPNHYFVHFTSFNNKTDEESLNNLLSILQKGFLFSENEVAPTLDENGEIFNLMNIEMVCFADITREYYLQHKAQYGQFGICIDKNFIRKKGGQPVIYSDQYNKDSINNKILKNLRDVTNYFATNNFDRDKNILKIMSSYYLFQAMTQPLETKEENEWRVIDIETFDLFEKNEPKKSNQKYLTINDDSSVCFLIIPTKFKDELIKKVENPDKYENKTIFSENFADCDYSNSIFNIYAPDK